MAFSFLNVLLHLGHPTVLQFLVLPAFEYLCDFFAVSISIHSKVLLRFFFISLKILFTFCLIFFTAILVLIWAFPSLSIDFPTLQPTWLFYWVFSNFYFICSSIFYLCPGVLLFFFSLVLYYLLGFLIQCLGTLSRLRLNCFLYVWSIPPFLHSSCICSWIAMAWLYLACSFPL